MLTEPLGSHVPLSSFGCVALLGEEGLHLGVQAAFSELW